MQPLSRLRLLASLGLLGLAACAPEPAPADPAAPAARESAPAVVVPTADGPVDLAALAGHPVVLQFAEAGDADAWAALGDALADLEAAGATVIAVTVDGAQADAAAAFGYTGAPLAVVVDGEGAVRGRGAPTTGDVLFALASPVLAEADVAATVEWQGAASLDALVAAGGLVVATEASVQAPRHALVIAPDTLAALDLPADLGTPIAFVGPDARDGAEAATRWGYAAVFVADADGALEPAAPTNRRRRGGVRG